MAEQEQTPTRLLERGIVVLVFALSAAIWWLVSGWLANADLSPGLSLLGRESPGFAGVLALLIGLIFAFGAGLIASKLFDITVGLMVLAGSLSIPAYLTGSVDGWVRRADLPTGLTFLSVELLLMVAVLAGCALLIEKLAPGSSLEKRRQLIRFQPDDLYAIAVSLGVYLAVTFVLGKSVLTGQVFAMALVGGIGSGIAARLAFKGVSIMPILLGPWLATIGSYLYLLLSGSNAVALRASYYQLTVPAPALALPLQAAAITMLGCALGVRWGDGMANIETIPKENPAVKHVSTPAPSTATSEVSSDSTS